MIRDEDSAASSPRTVISFANRYIGHRVSVEGEISRDEGQLIVRITAPDKIRIVDAAAPVTKASDELVLINEQGTQRRLTAEELSKLPREECEVERGGKRQKYSGVSLASVLEALRHCARREFARSTSQPIHSGRRLGRLPGTLVDRRSRSALEPTNRLTRESV